ncbi:MAG: hypothetical protein HKN07_04630 [Acidimicrobiia bacterium]|nr:hypothetical protein [Acidimicrobiia bacterium]
MKRYFAIGLIVLAGCGGAEPLIPTQGTLPDEIPLSEAVEVAEQVADELELRDAGLEEIGNGIP